jgi:hypothetical protein
MRHRGEPLRQDGRLNRAFVRSKLGRFESLRSTLPTASLSLSRISFFEVYSQVTFAVGARVVICGTASVSNWNPWPNGPRAERHLLVKRARMQGFVIFDYAPRFEEAVGRLAQWIRDGRLRYSEDILEGIEHAPGAIAGLYRGENTGKRLIRIR